MRTCWIAMVTGAVVAALCGAAGAADREASMIDSLGAKVTPSDESVGLSVFMSGEQVVQNTGGEWTFLLGGQYGTVSPRFVDDDIFWGLTVGLKWYLLPPTSISATLTYGQHDMPLNPDYRSAAIELKHRLLPADSAISPFLLLGGHVYSADALYEEDGAARIYHPAVSSDLAATAGAGIDVAMTDDMAVVMDATYTESEDRDDGWVMGISMKYYWK